MPKKFSIEDWYENTPRLHYPDRRDDILACLVMIKASKRDVYKTRDCLIDMVEHDLHHLKARMRRWLNCKNPKSITLYKMFLRYGKQEGKVRWDNYCDKQATTNTFEYKNKKYGMTKDAFHEYNKSRAVTLPNLIRRHGEEVGKRKYDNYKERQRDAGCTLEYFIHEYGSINGPEMYKLVCQKKGITLKNMIRVHGEIEGSRRYQQWLDSRPMYTSNIARTFCRQLSTIVDHNKVYYFPKTKEFMIRFEDEVFFYDFVDTRAKKCIEFNGDYWHLNPSKYQDTDRNGHGLLAAEVWQKEDRKRKALHTRGIDLLVIWESEWRSTPDDVLQRCRAFLTGDPPEVHHQITREADTQGL